MLFIKWNLRLEAIEDMKKITFCLTVWLLLVFAACVQPLAAQSKAILNWQPDETRQPKPFTEAEIKELMTAVENGRLEQVQNLLKEKPDLVKARDNDGWTPLIMAARFNHVNLIKLRLKSGAKVDDVDNEGSSALHHASASGRMEAVKALVENKARVSLKNQGGDTPRKLAKSSGHDKVADYLEKKKGF